LDLNHCKSEHRLAKAKESTDRLVLVNPKMDIRASPVSQVINKSAPVSLGWVRLLTVCIAPMFAYYLLVLMPSRPGSSILGVHVRLRHLPLIVVAGIGVLYSLIKWFHQRRWLSEKHLKGLTAASISLLVSTVAADAGYSAYLKHSTVQQVLDNAEPTFHRFSPTKQNFEIFKPNVSVIANIYGELYSPEWMKSPTLANFLLERRTISVTIDENGFRNTTPLSQAHIFALGDSFTYGDATTQERIWPTLLEKKLSRRVYNLGVPGTSPKQQLMLLEYVLREKADSARIEHLLWTIYEGNDLEDSYEPLNSAQESRLATDIRKMVETIKESSVINQLMVATSRFRSTHVVDGVKLAFPVYHSSRFGYRAFRPDFIEETSRSASYVLGHTNRPLLDQTFRDMAILSRTKGFEVTVIIAPTDIRLYWRYFENAPSIPCESQFINYVETLAKGLGFHTINLSLLMQPYAKDELLYWRADSHWNERGNEVVAEIIAKQLASDQP
jgi:hypothetical protein